MHFFIEGEIALMEENENEALENLHKALKLYPNSSTIYVAIGDVYQNQNDYLPALENYESAYDLNQDDALGFKIMGLYKQIGEIDKANNFLDQLLITHPKNTQLLYEKAQIHFTNENWEGLIQIYANIYELERDDSILKRMIEIGNATATIQVVYDEILMIEPTKDDEVILLEILSQIAYSLEEFQNSISHLDNLKQIVDSNAPYLLLGDIYMKTGNYREAKLNFEHVYNGGSTNFEIMRALLICYSNLNEVQNEISLSKSMMDVYPEENVGFESHALSLLEDGRISDAISTLLLAKQKFPKNFSILFYLGSSYKEIGLQDDALAEFELALKLQPESTIIWHSMALIYEDINQYEASDSLFSMILASDSRNAMDMNDYAYIISERETSTFEDLKFALDLAEKAIGLDPTNSMIMDTIGWIYFQLGESNLALKHLKNSIEIGGDNSVILEHLGDVYLKMGNVKKAQDNFNKAIILNPTNTKLKAKLEPLND
ncbi:MAG: tetratricopeptide repeat protein [Candidatus Marinimicrobia bacterium]|nr:tetratricopeptide repeat protein [Candidatus Neomarinimicrobiota bacterium]